MISVSKAHHIEFKKITGIIPNMLSFWKQPGIEIKKITGKTKNQKIKG